MVLPLVGLAISLWVLLFAPLVFLPLLATTATSRTATIAQRMVAVPSTMSGRRAA